MDKDFIIKEIRRVVKELNKHQISRKEFTNNSIVSRKDIDENFGGWVNAFMEAGFKPLKHHKISDEELFDEYHRLKKLLGHYPKKESEFKNNSYYSYGVFKKRFGGIKNFIVEYSKKYQTNGTERGLYTKGKVPQSVDDLLEDEHEFDKRRYYGDAAEYLIISELMFRGFNAQKLPIDEGLDIFAVRDNIYYLFQVKHANYKNPFESKEIKITTSSFKNNQGFNVFYIIVLSRKGLRKRDFIIFPLSTIKDYIKRGYIKYDENKKYIKIRIMHNKEDINSAYIGRITNEGNVSTYLNAWDVLTFE
jgi:hypothetical protein